jgi:anaerobic selenocysteine-containing dehydrogenase
MEKSWNCKEIKGYCSQCSCYCRIVSEVRDEIFVRVRPDSEHPMVTPICPKGAAGPELVYNKQRLQYPMKRTNPKGSGDPGWVRISWEEALKSISDRLNQVKSRYGAQAVATVRASPAGSAIGEVWPWIRRFANAFGTPNNISTTHVCQWHRDNNSAYTFGRPGTMGSAGRPEFENSSCMIIWGNNVHATRTSLLPLIEQGKKKGSKLIVIDPRRIELVDQADLWLQVNPETDGFLALSMIHVLLSEGWFDESFTRDWTTAPFLVREDTGNFLRPNDLAAGGDPSGCMAADAAGALVNCLPGVALTLTPALDVRVSVRVAGGETVACETVFNLLRKSVAAYAPDRAAEVTGIPAAKIRETVRMITQHRPVCWYSWNGIEQNVNASQTNRAICIFYALNGDYDRQGGNALLPPMPVNPVLGLEFADPARKGLGYGDRPLSASASAETQGYELYKSLLTGKPYEIKALLAFGGNLITSSGHALVAREALNKLEFHAHMEMFLTPTAELADIVLPAASSWESWHVGLNIASGGEKGYIQLRPAVVPPQHESRMDMEVLFDLADRLGLGDRFWNGDVEAGFNHMLAPSGVTVEQLRRSPSGVAVDLRMKYRKYLQKDGDGRLTGFPTPSKRMEIYSQVYKDRGYEPLPSWREPSHSRLKSEYPLILTGGKVVQYSHSQHRALPSLRRAVPHPFLEIHPQKAGELGIRDQDWVLLETVHGAVTLQAKLTEGIACDVVSMLNGWWQGCPELGLPGYDPCSSDGANMNMLSDSEEMDVISGSLPLKGYPCRIRRKAAV